MKRSIMIKGEYVTLRATLNTNGTGLSREHVERVHTELADALMRVVAEVRWLGTALSRIKVSPRKEK